MTQPEQNNPCVLSWENDVNKSTDGLLTNPDLGLLYLRLTGCVLLLCLHGLPKLLHFSEQLKQIEDPFGMGAVATLSCAVFAEVVCPIAMILGWFTRLAALPVIFLLLVAMLVVHADWSFAQGQFGWLLVIIFGTIALAGPGRFTVPLPGRKSDE